MRRPLFLFLLIALAQLVAPAWMMWRYEQARGSGTEYRFRTAPIDPRDPFRGEHVLLEFEAEAGPFALPAGWTSGPLYAELGTGSEGYALITGLTADKPDGDHLPVIAEDWSIRVDDGTVTRVNLPFDRYYMREGHGPRTEELLMEQWNEDEHLEPLPTHAVVHVYDGRAVVMDLIIGGRSVEAWMKDPS